MSSVQRRLVGAVVLAAAGFGTTGVAAQTDAGTAVGPVAGSVVVPVVVGDAVPAPLTTTPGDAARGRAIVADRQVGLCLLCHAGPFPEERFQGTLAPDLSGAGARWNEGQLRLRVVDARAVNPETIMPSYHRTTAGRRVARAWLDRPVLDAQQIEDVVAFLVTLKR